MKKFLPKFLIAILTFGIFLTSFPSYILAATVSSAPTPVPAVAAAATGSDNPNDGWVVDKEVTFVGKNAARSGLLLDWTLQDYKWATIQPGSQNPLIPFWITIRNIVYALFILFVIVTAFILVTTRGRSLSAKRFLPRFVVVILLVTFSFALLQFLYQITDGIQGFFLRDSPSVSCPPDCISQKDLFYWSWNYNDFVGLRKIGESNNESVYIALILTKLSAMTYYVMIGILIVRKIILWFFIIVSPIFPLLLLYYPVRNTAKIWIGEFFRWLFYAPLFAVFLAGLVSLWQQNIPMKFISSGQAVYPTAVNILLAGPQQSAAFNNSLNMTDTYALYIVALIMLWVVIILPFILLQVFLDYLNRVSLHESPGISQIMTMINKRFPPSPSPKSPMPTGPSSTGLARALPFRGRIQIPTTTGLAKSIPIASVRPAQVPISQNIKTHDEILKLTNLAVPTIRDIARFESARLQKDTQQTKEISQIKEHLEKIANPNSITNSTEKERYSQMRDSLIKERDLGNPMATSILKAAESVSTSKSSSTEKNTLVEVLKNIAKPEIVRSLEKDRYVELRERIEKESEKGSSTASSILKAVNTVSSSQRITDTASIKEIVRQLAVPATQANEKVTSLKNELTRKEQEGDTLAKEVIKTVETVTSTATKEEKEQQITILKERLLQEANKGNEVATSLLTLLKQEDSTEDVTQLKERLATAKEQGDTLAATLLTLIAEKEAEEKAKENVAVKPADIKSPNRIQQVSLDDYEAVKDMWIDNYQNLDVPKTLSGEDLSRKEWIKEDMDQISDTINLLSSTDEEKIKEGMDQVSNILPFLLIGGFSQEEIVTYLKAKLEAGKVAQKIVEVTDKEDDTLLESKKSSREESRIMTTSTSVQNAVPTYSTSSGDEEKVTSTHSPAITIQNLTINTTPSSESQKILTLANISLPKIAEIAKYEAGLRSGTKDQPSQLILNTISSIANPGEISDTQKRLQMLSLRDTLIKESEKGNVLASSILKASGVIDKEKTTGGVEKDELGSVITLLKKIFDPSLVKNTVDREKYIDLAKKIEEKAKTSEKLALAITQVLKSMTQDYIFSVHELFTEINNPETISDPGRKEKIQILSKTLFEDQKAGESLATSIINSSKQAINIGSIIDIKTSLVEEKEKGNSLAAQIMEVFPSIPAINVVSAQNIAKVLSEEELENNPLAIHIKTFLLKKDDIIDENILLPESNRIQVVSLDDYESVKKLWLDYYQNTPKDGLDILEKDEKEIHDAINLLSSPDKKSLEEGMEKVRNILPFLLIGGFSQSEVVSYLKAKLEALKEVRFGSKESDTEVFVEKTHSVVDTSVAKAKLDGDDN